MKRRISKQAALAALLTAGLLMGTAAGCAKKEELKLPESSITADTQSKKKETAKEEKTEVKGTPVALKLFSMTCPDGWTINEEKKYDEDRSSKTVMDIMDGDNSLVNLEVRAYGDSASSYRDALRLNDIDAYEMVENNAYTIKNIGGIDVVEAAGEEKLCYIGRDESSGMTVTVTANGDVADPRVEEVISTISFTLPDEGKTDPPWPWNGERFSTDKEHTAMAADKTIRAEYIPFEEPMLANDIFSGRVELVGDSLWVLVDGRLYEYSIGETLTFVKEVELPKNNYEELSSDVNGNLYVTRFMNPMLTVKDGTIIASNDGTDRAFIDKSGTFGISSFIGNVPEKITISDNTASVSEWAFIEKEKVRKAGLTQNSIYVEGEDPETENNVLWIYDKNGNLKKSLGNTEFPQEGSIAALTDVIETGSGFMALDGNARKLLLWKTDGTLLGEIKDEEIFGTGYPWISTASLGDDGTIYVGLTEERDDESADEFVVYRLTGF